MMNLRVWEASMTQAGATKLRVNSSKRGEYDASALIGGRTLTVTCDDMQIACARLLERCREETSRAGTR
jgi:hypothetical protein